MILGHERKALDAINKSRLCKVSMTLCRELRVMDDINDYGLSVEGSRCFE